MPWKDDIKYQGRIFGNLACKVMENYENAMLLILVMRIVTIENVLFLQMVKSQ